MKAFLLTLGLGVASYFYLKHRSESSNIVKAALTPLTLESARRILREAYRLVFGAELHAEEEAVLLAHSAHETAEWAKMWNHNWGGIKATKGKAAVNLRTKEGYGATESTQQANFAAYPSALVGAVEFLGLLKRRYGLALERAAAGDPRGYAEALQSKGYFTGSPAAYAKSLERLYNKYLTGTMSKPEDEALSNLQPDWDISPEGVMYVSSLPGYRRAAENEVTSDMIDAANAALSHPLMTIIPYPSFAIAVENHKSQEKGVHKGASVFVLA